MKKRIDMKTYSVTVSGRTFQSPDWRRLCELAVAAFLEEKERHEKT